MVLTKEVELSANVETVWRAWTASDQVAQWFAPAAEVEARVGGKYEVYFYPANRDIMSTKGCTVLELERPKRLAFNWKGPDQFTETMNVPGRLTVVEVTLRTGGGDGTTVVLLHRGWGEGEAWETARQWHERAWDDVLASLKRWLESAK